MHTDLIQNIPQGIQLPIFTNEKRAEMDKYIVDSILSDEKS